MDITLDDVIRMSDEEFEAYMEEHDVTKMTAAEFHAYAEQLAQFRQMMNPRAGTGGEVPAS